MAACHHSNSSILIRILKVWRKAHGYFYNKWLHKFTTDTNAQLQEYNYGLTKIWMSVPKNMLRKKYQIQTFNIASFYRYHFPYRVMDMEEEWTWLRIKTGYITQRDMSITV